jgi:hypothetical protein
MGYEAGYSATNANNSTFIGRAAGKDAASANNSNFIGNNAGKDATNANNSNFLGQQAGQNASGSTYSNFIGDYAGYSATSASQSNFIGPNTGWKATNASGSNFFGFNAGYSATNASNSNFIGQKAGYQAAGAYISNFIGTNAGSGATSAYQSNFLGFSAGVGAINAHDSNFLGGSTGEFATNAANSNFFGSLAGYQATNAYASNFFGLNAGLQATGASQSNFLGTNAGSGAANSNYSNFFGQDAGKNATGASGSNFLGQAAGLSATTATYSNFIGSNAGQYATGAAYSSFLGLYAGYKATNAYRSNFLGNNAGSSAGSANDSNFLGTSAGSGATYASYSNFMGLSAGYNAYNSPNSNFFGYNAGINATNAAQSNFIGSSAGGNATNAQYSNFLGASAGANAINANNSNFIGENAGIDATNAANSIFIGKHAGSGNTVNNTASYDDITTFANTSILLGHKTNTSGYSNSIALGAYAVNTSTNQLVVGSVQRPISALTIANVAYILPTTQGGTNTYLKNDGAGNLTWSTVYTGTTNLGNILFVSPYGNDSTGIRGYIDKPYLTLKGARDAAISGDTIHVFPQTFIFDNRATNSLFWNNKQADINLWKNGVTYFFEPNCKIKFYNQTITGQDLYLISPTTTTGETCTVLGYLEYEQYGTGNDTFNGSNTFYSVGNAYSGNTPNSNAHTFYAQLKSLYSEHCEFIRINRVSGATAESKITIITDTETRKYVSGQSGFGTAVYISGVQNGVTDDPFLNITLYSKYRDVINSTPFYIRGNLNGSTININGEVSVIKNQGNLLRQGKFTLNYNIDKTYYTRGQNGNLWYGSFMSTTELNNSTINIKGDLIDYLPNSETNGIFHVGNISYNNTVNFDGNITTTTNSGIGRFIALTDGVVTGNTINIKGDINYIGTGVTTQYMFRTNGGSGNTINYNGKITGNFAAPITNCYSGIININNSHIKSTIDGSLSSIGLNGSTNLGTVRINNSYIELKNSTNFISNGSYVKHLINNSTIINSGGSGFSNTTSFGTLQTLNSTIITSGTSINYTSTSPVISSNSITNNTYNINTLYGDISTITEIII